MTTASLLRLHHLANTDRRAACLLNKWRAARPDERAEVEREIDEYFADRRPERYSPVKETK